MLKVQKIGDYDKIYNGEDRNRPISSPIRICQEGADKGSEVASSLPRCDMSSSGGVSFVQIFGEVAHEINRYPIIC